MENPAALENVDLNLSDADADDGGRHGMRLLRSISCSAASGRSRRESRATPSVPREKALSPPVLFDNLDELRAQYEATLSEYRAKRTHVVNALIMLSFFGGLALALLVTMLALLRIVWGSRLWLPTVVATVCCVVVTAVSNEPSRMKPVEATAVGFAPCTPPPDAEPKEQDRGEPAAAEPMPADGKLRSLAEKLSKTEGDAEELKSDRFAVRQYARPTRLLLRRGRRSRETAGLVSASDRRSRWPRNLSRPRAGCRPDASPDHRRPRRRPDRVVRVAGKVAGTLRVP